MPCFADDPVWTKSEYYKKYQEHGYPWENSSVGVDSNVPSPWSPVEANVFENSYSAGASVFQFNNQVLPTHIKLKDKDILAKPITLTIGSGEQKFHVGRNATIANLAEESVVLDAVDSVFGMDVRSNVELQYDGFLLITVELQANAPVEIDLLQLDVGLRIEGEVVYSRYLDYDYEAQKFDRGTLNQSVKTIDSPIKDKFTPHLTIENSEYGIEWLAETNSGYSLVDEFDAVAVTKDDSVVNLNVTLINKKKLVDRKTAFQFALFVIPSRDATLDDKFYVSRQNSHSFKKSFSKACCIKPFYFGTRRRVPFEIDGLPGIAKNEDGRSFIENELPQISSVGGGYAPYTTMHLLSTQIEALAHYQKLWEASSIRRKRLSLVPGKLPVSYEHKSIADFVIHNHSDAIVSQKLKSIYHDVAGMTSLTATMERILSREQLQDGVAYYPFFGFREFAKRYWKVVKRLNPDLEIVWHTGAILPKSISTYTDKIVFGESFHFMFSSLTTNEDFPEYNPDYFALNKILFEGPLKQKNGFSYMILPQILRKENRQFSKDILKNKTRSLLAFALLNRYPVWGTRILFSEYRKLLKYIDKFGGIGSAEFTLSYIRSTQGDMDVAVYQKGMQKLFVVVNVDQEPVTVANAEQVLKEKFSENLYKIDAAKNEFQPFDYMLYAEGGWF